MGPAVSDAAAWYDKADWIGVHATPRASIHIQSLLERATRDLEHVVVDYPVPLKSGNVLNVKAVNWPKGFYVQGLRPEGHGERTRAKLLSLLREHEIPLGTESKYFNAIRFFDYIEKTQKPGRAAVSSVTSGVLG